MRKGRMIDQVNDPRGAGMRNYSESDLVTRTSITRYASRSLVHPPSQQTCQSSKREPIVTVVFKRRNFISSLTRVRYSWLWRSHSQAMAFPGP